MPFRPMGTVKRSIRTRDVAEADAFMSGDIRPGMVKPTEPGGEIRIGGQYYAEQDFVVGRICGSGFAFYPDVELDAVLLWCGLKGDIVIEHAGRQEHVGPNDVVITSARSTKRVTYESPYHGILLGVSSAAVKREMASFLGHEVEGPLDFMTRVDARGREGAGLVALASALQAGLSGESALLSSPLGLRQHKDAAIAMMMLAAGKEAVEDWSGPVSQLSLQELRRADEFMRDHAHEPIGIGDVAQHLGISVRKLQYTFRRHRDTTPLAVLRRFRLEGVRRDLGTPEAGSIAEVALRWGFTNLGRFSRQYRGEFQEKPSQTLAKARQRRHPG